MELKTLRADPAGNITIFVLDPVERERRAAVSARLMARPELGAEQVAFVCSPVEGGDGRFEMMGGEFCGNATRAFGMLLSRHRGGLTPVRVETSGCDRVVSVEVDAAAGTARAEMPLPRGAQPVAVDGRKGILVHLGGIAHLVVEGVAPSQAFFDRAEPLLRDIPGLEAYGVIFLEGEEGRMTPLVKVPATNTLVWEGSCGSGTLAAAVAQSANSSHGTFTKQYAQPAGVICATVERSAGAVTAAYIGGPVTLDAPLILEV